MLVDFIIPTYNREKALQSMLASLVAQTSNNWQASVIIDDVANDNIIAIIDKLNCSNIRYSFTGIRYNDFGHSPREIGKQQSSADYVIMTGDDNYYVPSFVKELEQVVHSHPGLVYWDMIHNGYQYKPFTCNLRLGEIDMGAFATKTTLAQQLSLNTKRIEADGIFVLDFIRKFPKESIVKIAKTLFVHN